MNMALNRIPLQSVVKMAVSGIFFFVICLFPACKQKPTASETRELEKAISIQKVEDFQKLHRGTADWFRVLDSVSPYTLEIQEALLSGDDSPRLLIADLLDISKNGEEIIASFGNEWIETEPHFRLRMTPEQAKEIVKVVPEEDRLLASFVLAFRPQSVARPILRLDAEKRDEYAEVEVQNSQATIITGECIAWQYLGANGINMSDFLESQTK
jgi:hypothetical protein